MIVVRLNIVNVTIPNIIQPDVLPVCTANSNAKVSTNGLSDASVVSAKPAANGN